MIVSINGIINKDLQLDFLHKEIESAEPQTHIIKIPLRDGSVNLTKNLSPIPRYNNRKIHLDFEIRTDRSEWPLMMEKLYSLYHGKDVEIVFDDDSNWKWTGYCIVNRLEDHGFTAGVSFDIDAQPFKRTIAPVIDEEIDLSSADSYRVTLDFERGFPEFVVTEDTSIFYQNNEFAARGWYNVSPSQPNAYGLTLVHGENILSVFSDGTVRIKVYGGSL